MPEQLTYELEIAVPDKAKQLSVNGKLLENWKVDEKGMFRVSCSHYES